ncbi:MAG: phosphotransferase, partial [Gammaproteobacteria bacterium]|nr:phosphotransferase [Gammaproteobacteria bacterium]
MKMKDEICKLISEVPEFDNNVNITFQYLPKGITNENYWIKINGYEYVLRINNPDSELLGLDRNAEIMIMSEVAPLNIAPEHIFYSQKSNFYLSKWIAGEVWCNNDLQKQINLNRLAQRLKLLHNLPSHSFPRIDLIKRLDLYRSMIQKRHGDL